MLSNKDYNTDLRKSALFFSTGTLVLTEEKASFCDFLWIWLKKSLFLFTQYTVQHYVPVNKHDGKKGATV